MERDATAPCDVYAFCKRGHDDLYASTTEEIHRSEGFDFLKTFDKETENAGSHDGYVKPREPTCNLCRKAPCMRW